MLLCECQSFIKESYYYTATSFFQSSFATITTKQKVIFSFFQLLFLPVSRLAWEVADELSWNF